MVFRFLLTCSSILFLFSCKKEIDIKVSDLNLNTQHSETPDLVLTPQEKLYQTWIERFDDSTDILYYSIFNDSTWTKGREITRGKDWFVNWADFPTLSVFAGTDLNLMASFLQKNITGKTYDYDIKLALSNNGGDNFRIIDSIHSAVPGEHGFVTILPFSYNKNFLIWLDGSHMTSGHDTSSPHDHHGSMQLRSALIDINGKITDKTLLDDMTCECCQTDMAMTPKGPVIVYRNKTADDIRDIYYLRYLNGNWSEPTPLSTENWKIGGCPVNGPAIASFSNHLAVVYYTEALEKPEIKLSISENAGESFSEPKTIDTKNTSGRLDIVWIHTDLIAISYLDKKSKESTEAEIRVSFYNAKAEFIADRLISTISSKRKSGFPVMQALKGDLFLSYTEVQSDTTSHIRSKKIELLSL